MRAADARASRLLDIVTPGLAIGEERRVDATNGHFPGLLVERFGHAEFGTAQASEPFHPARTAPRPNAVWRRSADKLWMPLAIDHPLARLVALDTAGAMSQWVTFEPNRQQLHVLANLWLGIIFPIQQGGWYAVRAAVESARSTQNHR
jgi:hypothetical protein